MNVEVNSKKAWEYIRKQEKSTIEASQIVPRKSTLSQQEQIPKCQPHSFASMVDPYIL